MDTTQIGLTNPMILNAGSAGASASPLAERRTLLIRANPLAKWGVVMKWAAVALSILLLSAAFYLTLKSHLAERRETALQTRPV